MKVLIWVYAGLVLLLAAVSYAATKPRVYSGPEPPTKTEFDNELRDLYNAINALPLVQHDTVTIVDAAGLDSVRFHIPRPYKDTSYAVSVCLRGYNGGLTEFSISHRTDNSFRITTGVGTDILCDVITVGERP